MPWKTQLKTLLSKAGSPRNPHYSLEDVRAFLADIVAPALREVAQEMHNHDREGELEISQDKVALAVFDREKEEFYYAVRARAFRRTTFAFPEMTFKDEAQDRYYRAVVYTRRGALDYGLMGYDHASIIRDFMHEYDRTLRWQRPGRREAEK